MPSRKELLKSVRHLNRIKVALLAFGATIDWNAVHLVDGLEHQAISEAEHVVTPEPAPKINTYFEQDNFTTRRTTGHNMLDPESFITGRELAQGFTYTNSHRHFSSQALYDAIVSGEISITVVPHLAPRVFNQPQTTVTTETMEVSDAQ